MKRKINLIINLMIKVQHKLLQEKDQIIFPQLLSQDPKPLAQLTIIGVVVVRIDNSTLQKNVRHQNLVINLTQKYQLRK